ncbi:regulatory protein, luxR family, partial [Streptomyces sp. di50b]
KPENRSENNHTARSAITRWIEAEAPAVSKARMCLTGRGRQAHPCAFTRSCSDESEGLTPQEHKLLQLLATGLTDEAVARTLGIGVRTERRMTAELMERLGASSRFEAGVQAARRQWI